MMTLDYVDDEEAMAYAQVDQHPLARTTETSPERSSGTLSCLSAWPPDLATATAAQPEVACVRPAAEHCPVCILQARGGGAIPEVVLSTIDRFVHRGVVDIRGRRH